MPVTSTPIFAQAPYFVAKTLAAQTACTTRGPTATASLAAANIIEVVPTSTNGLRIDAIQDKIDLEQRNLETGITRKIEQYQEQVSDLQRTIEIQFDRPI